MLTRESTISKEPHSAVIRLSLRDAPDDAMLGVFGEGPVSGEKAPHLWLDVSATEARVRWGRAEAMISLRHGARSFVASWVLPLISHGYVGYDPGESLPVLLTSGSGEYWCLDATARLQVPIRGNERSLYFCFFGNFHSLRRIDELARQLSDAAHPDANAIFNTAWTTQFPPAVLLTAFGGE